MLARPRRSGSHLRVRSRDPLGSLSPILAVFHDRDDRVRPKVIGLHAVLGVANLFAWLWAFVLFRNDPLLLATCLIAYGFGLRWMPIT